MAQPPHILLCFAVNEEARAFTALTPPLPRVEVLVTGMGRRNAETAVRQAIVNRRPELVVTSGFAGGLHPGLASGTVVFDAEPETGLRQTLLSAGAVAIRFHCADRVAVTAAEKQQLRATTGADAVEMESGAIRALCRDERLPAATVRVILDTAQQDLPLDFNTLLTSRMRLDGRKLALAIAGAPGRIPSLFRFQKQTRAAAQRLAGTLRRVLLSYPPR